MKVPKTMLLAVAVVMAAPGCGHSNAWQERMTQLRSEVSETADAGAVTLRYNRPECDCPPWEMKLSKRWVRVQIVESTDPALPLEELEKEGKRKAAAGEATGSPLTLALETGKPSYCANGTPYFLMSVHPAGD